MEKLRQKAVKTPLTGTVDFVSVTARPVFVFGELAPFSDVYQTKHHSLFLNFHQEVHSIKSYPVFTLNGRYQLILLRCWINALLKLHPRKDEMICVATRYIFFPTSNLCVIIFELLLGGHGSTLWKPQNAKKQVPKSDIAYILMISTDIDGDQPKFQTILLNVLLC